MLRSYEIENQETGRRWSTRFSWEALFYAWLSVNYGTHNVYRVGSYFPITPYEVF